MRSANATQRRLAVLAAAVALGVAACGGSGHGSRTGAGTGSAVGTASVSPSAEALHDTGPVAIDGTLLASYRGLAVEDVAVGDRAPDVTGEDIGGGQVRVAADGQGTKKLVVVLAHWMTYSDVGAATLASWLGISKVPDGVGLYVVSSYVRPTGRNYPPSTWLRRALGSQYLKVRVLVDNLRSEAAKAYGASRLPFWVFLDEDNSVRARYAGQLSAAELDDLVGSFVRGTALSLPAHGWRGDTSQPTATAEPEPAPEPEPIESRRPEPTATPAPQPRAPGGAGFTRSAASLMSMIGRPLTDAEISAMSRACYRAFYYRQDIHCEEEQGFGLSLDGDRVHEVYLYDYWAPNQSSFPGVLPGGARWNSTLGSIIAALGRPECVTSIVGYGLHYTLGGRDVEFVVDADMLPTADLQKITIRAVEDRPLDCHPYRR